MPTVEETQAVGSILASTNVPLKARFKALFVLKSIGTPDAINSIGKVFSDSSSLLKHELAYVLGQTQSPAAVEILKNLLVDASVEPIVRHEAGEALGAIGLKDYLPLLEQFSSDEVVEVAETCQLAAELIKWLHSDAKEPHGPNADAVYKSPAYTSIDPAPPLPYERDPDTLERMLLDEKETLFNRYRAMFSLRNMGGEKAVNSLAKGLKCSSALFRHEVAFVLGQMQDERAYEGLASTLEDAAESPMVRHEAAESLGSIATEECNTLLKKYLSDGERVVRESCEVALDMSEYVNGDEFEYADTLVKLHAAVAESPENKS